MENRNEILIYDEISFEEWCSEMESYILSFDGVLRRQCESSPDRKTKNKQWIEWMEMFMEFISQDSDRRMEVVW